MEQPYSEPFVSLRWEKCSRPPVGMFEAQLVLLGNRVFVRGGLGYVYIYELSNDTWNTLESPTYYSSLTTYQEKLVLVGGVDASTSDTTNNLWMMEDEQTWTKSLPPMPTPRRWASAVSAENRLVVAGGLDDRLLNVDVVEVYDGQKWSAACPLPTACHSMKSTLYDGNYWYLLGGYGQSRDVFCTSLEDLVTTVQGTAWNSLPSVPLELSSPATVGNWLIAIGGSTDSSASPDIYAYSPGSQSWKHVGHLPIALHSTCTITLPTGELLVVGGASARVFKGTVRGRVTLTNYFSVGALEQLEASTGISVFKQLAPKYPELASQLNISLPPTFASQDTLECSKAFFGEWLRSKSSQEPTWETLVSVLKELQMKDLVECIEDWLMLGKLEDDLSTFSDSCSETSGIKSWEIEVQPSDSERDTGLGTKPLSEGASLGRDDELERVRQEYEHLSEAVQALEETVECREKELEATKQELSQTRVTSEEQLAKREMQVNQCKRTIQMYQTLYQKQLQQIQSLNEQLREQPIKVESTDGNSLMAAVPMEQSARPGYIRGVDIIGETNLLVTNDAQTFHWVGYGLKFHIPPASLPAGVEKSSIEVKATLAGQFKLPENTTLISAVYWIKCLVKLAQPLTLELQHCGKHSLFSFVVTKRSQKELPYQFTQLKGGEFNCHSSYGSITLSHFCGLGIVQEGSGEQLYCARLYYLGSRIDWRVDFVITKDLEAEYTAISDSYAAKGAIEGLDQEVEFTADRITLDIPADGIIVKEGWSIRPLIHPTVMMKQVANYRSGGHRIPSCKLSVKWVKPEELQPLDLCHRVNMQGAKEPYNYITIEADPQPKALQSTGSSLQDSSVRDRTADTTKFLTTEPKLPNFMDLVAAEISSKWRLMGIQLHLKDSELDCIEVTSDDPMRCFSSVFTLWKRKETRLPLSWSTVLQALEAPSVGEHRLARCIRCQLTDNYEHIENTDQLS